MRTLSVIWVIGMSGMLFLASATAQPLPISDDRPNIIVIITDDQRIDQLQYMPTVQKLAQEGFEFTKATVSTPLSSPSRATFFTGQFVHNHGLIRNKLGFNENNTIAVSLQEAGYSTALYGKYLANHEKKLDIPSGWSEWQVTIPAVAYFDYKVNANGKIEEHGESSSDYSIDVLKEKALAFIANAHRPFFLYFASAAPHGDPSKPLDTIKPIRNVPLKAVIAAPRHQNTCDDLEYVKHENFNEADVRDKANFIKQIKPRNLEQITEINEVWRGQICSLKAVDEALAEMIKQLGPEIQNTVIIYTSDNGLLLGEHRLVQIKNFAYEEAIRVPLIIYYPGKGAGIEIDKLVQNIDLAPTIVDIANATPTLSMDGESLLKIIEDQNAEWRDAVLIETFPKKHSSNAVRTANYKYIEYSSGESELYDLEKDPYETQNVVTDSRYDTTVKELKSILSMLKDAG